MSVSFLARRALVLRPATTPVAQRSLATTARRLADKAHQEQKAKLQEESKRNPEILVRFYPNVDRPFWISASCLIIGKC